MFQPSTKTEEGGRLKRNGKGTKQKESKTRDVAQEMNAFLAWRNSLCRLLSPPCTLREQSPHSTGTEDTPFTGNKGYEQGVWLSIGKGWREEKWPWYILTQFWIIRLGTAVMWTAVTHILARPQPHILWALSQNFLHPAPPLPSLWPCSFLSLNPILPSPAQKHLFTLQQKGVEAKKPSWPSAFLNTQTLNWAANMAYNRCCGTYL